MSEADLNDYLRVKGKAPDGQPFDEVIPVPKTISSGDRRSFVESYLHTAFTGEDSEFSPSGTALTREQRMSKLAEGLPPAEGAPGFIQKLGGEISGGASQFLRGAAGPEPYLSPGGVPQVADMALGATRVAAAFPMALGAAAGKATLEATDSPVAAGVADTIASFGIGPLAGPLAGTRAGAKIAKLGINYGASGLLGSLAGGVNRGARKLATKLPGAGTALMDVGKAEMRAIPEKFLPSVPSSQLYDVVEQMNPAALRMPNLQKAAKEIADNEKTLSKFGVESQNLIGTAADIEGTLAAKRVATLVPSPTLLNNAGQSIPQSVVKTVQPTVEFRDARAVLRRLGQRIDDLRDPLRRSTGSGEELGEMKKLYGAALKDLETTQAGPALMAANAAAKREFGVRELRDVVEKGIKSVQGADLPENANFGTMLNALKKEIATNELFTQAFPAKELEKITGALEELRKLPVPRPARGAPVGSSLQARRAGIGGALGSSMGAYVGGPGGAMTGGAIGSFSGIVIAEAISAALVTPAGRRMLVGIVRNQPGFLFTPQGAALLSAAARAASVEDQSR